MEQTIENLKRIDYSKSLLNYALFTANPVSNLFTWSLIKFIHIIFLCITLQPYFIGTVEPIHLKLLYIFIYAFSISFGGLIIPFKTFFDASSGFNLVKYLSTMLIRHVIYLSIIFITSTILADLVSIADIFLFIKNLIVISFFSHTSLYLVMVAISFSKGEDLKTDIIRREEQHMSGHLISILGLNNEEKIVVKPDDFLFAKSEGHYIKLYYLATSHNDKICLKKRIIRNSMKNVESMITGNKSIFRIHKSYIANVGKVSKVRGGAHGGALHYHLDQNNTFQVPYSRSYYTKLKNYISTTKEGDYVILDRSKESLHPTNINNK